MAAEMLEKDNTAVGVCLCFPCPVFLCMGDSDVDDSKKVPKTPTPLLQSPSHQIYINQKPLHNFAWCTVCFKG